MIKGCFRKGESIEDLLIFNIFEKTAFMKNILIAIALLISGSALGQGIEKEAVQEAIETFFIGFHAQDTLALQQSAADVVVLQTISKDSLGNTMVRSTPYDKFVQGMAGIPKTTKFEEKLKSFTIQVDGKMANAWTPYEFWLNDKFHHCGVNSFQLVKFEEEWKIVYLIDTRRKQDCD